MIDFKSFLSQFVKSPFHLTKRKILSFLLRMKYFIFVHGVIIIIGAFFQNQFRDFLLMFIFGVQWVGISIIFITNAEKIKRIPLIRTNKKFPFHFKNILKILYLLMVLVSHFSAMLAFFVMTLVIADVIRDLNFEDAAFASIGGAFTALFSLFISLGLDFWRHSSQKPNVKTVSSVNQHNSNVQSQNSQSNQSAHPKIQHINKGRKDYKAEYNTVNTINSQHSTSSMGLSFPDTQEQISVTIGEKVGSGGEGDVYERKNYPNEAIKLYNKQALARIPKLKAMISNPPEDKTKSAGHISIAWPTALALDERSGKSGFIMPRIKATIGLHQLYHPKTRRETAPNITWEHIVSIGYNLSTVVNSLHEKGYVIGDLNESNILVNDKSLISLIDCDSMQVQDRTTTYYCTVAKREYAAPELIGQDLSSLKRSPDSDVFSLAVLLFMLLMEGTSPFAGTQLGNLTLEEQKQTGNSPYLPTGTLQPPVSAPPFDILPKQIQGLFQESLKPYPPRPPAHQWQQALKDLKNNLKYCPQVSTHVYSKHLKVCPWCERKKKLHIDSYPFR